MSVIWDIDKVLGLWIDGSSSSAHSLNRAIVEKARVYGYVIPDPQPQTVEEWNFEADEAYDYLNSICPYGYWFTIRDNCLFLETEDE